MSSDMEMKMQDRYDGWDAQMTAAHNDLRAYGAYMLAGDTKACLEIETGWGLDGLPPEQVSVVLAAVADGSSVDAAFDSFTAQPPSISTGE